MTSRIQTQRFATTGTRPSNGIRPPGELWLNFPDFRLGMVDPTKAPVDLLPIRVYAPSATYAQGDFVVNAGQLLQARLALAPKPFAITDWNQFQSIAQTDARYLALSGGVLTGPLTLAGNPTAANGAANKAYVDTSVSNSASSILATVGSTYLPLAGGNLTGALGVGGTGIAYPSLGSYWAAHHVAIGWDGTQPEFAADGVGIGALAMQPWTVANFLSINGGTLHGGLTVQGRITFANLGASAHGMEFGWDGAEIQAWVDGTYIGGLATEAYVGNYLPLTGGVTSGTVRVGNGRLLSSNAGGNPSVTAWDTSGGYAVGFWGTGGNMALGGMDGSGTPSVEWGALNGGGLALTGYLQLGGLGASPAFQFTAGSNLYTLFFTNWALQYSSAAGQLTWYNYQGVGLFWCDNGGSLHARTDVDVGQDVNAARQVSAQAGVYAVGGNMGMFAGGSGRILQISPNWYFDWNGSNGDLHWYAGSRVGFEFRASDGNAGNDLGAVYGYGAYINLSDERVKTDIQPSPYGLPEILQLNPIAFERTNVVSVRREHGFSAQQVQSIIPEAVVAVTQDSDPLLGINIDPIVAALVNATKDIAARLAHLERIVS